MSTTEYVYRPAAAAMTFDEATQALSRRVARVAVGGIDNASPQAVARIVAQGRDAGLDFRPLEVDVAAFRHFFEKAGYAERYAHYYRGNQVEKALEHWITFSLLDAGPDDVFVDVASENSPLAEVFSRLAGTCTFSQDIQHPRGVQGSIVGGDACAMPLADGFVSKAALTCSLEHFEGDADARLFVELARVLRPGGSVCVVPFYVHTEHAVQTDPQVSLGSGVDFDADARVHCVQGWGNRHGRFYSPDSFKRRVMDAVAGRLDFRFHHVVNAADVDPSIYVRFAMVATRRV